MYNAKFINPEKEKENYFSAINKQGNSYNNKTNYSTQDNLSSEVNKHFRKILSKEDINNKRTNYKQSIENNKNQLTPNGLVKKFNIPLKTKINYNQNDVLKAKESLKLLLKNNNIDKNQEFQRTFMRDNEGLLQNHVLIKKNQDTLNVNNPIDIIKNKSNKENKIDIVDRKEDHNKLNLNHIYKSTNNYHEEHENYDDNNNYTSPNNINSIKKKDKFNENDESYKENINLKECNDCKRKFNEEVYDKHIKICKNVFIKKRKSYNIKEKRVINDEHKEILNNANRKQNKSKVKEKDVIKTAKKNWKAKSEMFRMAIKVDDNKIKNNINDNININIQNDIDILKYCSLCKRKYNDSVYDKHLPTCEKKAKIKAITKKN